jgi:drug/metabolite transporter (DMT)-like permease
MNNPYALMSVLLVFWGSFSAISKLTLNNIDSFQMQFYMFGVAVLVMTVIGVVTGKVKGFRKISAADYIRLVLYALPSFFYYFFYTLSLNMIPAVEASMLNYLFPILIVLFAVPINREKLDGAKLISIVMGFVGMVIILTNGRIISIKITNITGDLLAIAGAVSWAVYSNLGKRNKLDAFVSNYVCSLVQFVLSLVCLFAFSGFTVPDMLSLSGVIWLSLGNIVLTFFIWFRALKLASSALIASISFITPFITLTFIMLLLGERITLVQVAGLLVIVGGIAVQALAGIKNAIILRRDV